MTRRQAIATMQNLRPRLGWPILGVDGFDGDLGQLMIATPAGHTLAVDVALPSAFPVVDFTPLIAAAQGSIRAALRPFEGEAGRGFFGSRGTLTIGEPGYAPEGFV